MASAAKRVAWVCGIAAFCACLLAEGIPINNLPLILEKCGNYASQTKDPAVLTELVRKPLGRVICMRHCDAQGNMNVLSLDPQLEEEIRESLEKADGQIRINLPPNRLRQIVAGISEQAQKAFGGGMETVVVTDAQLRPCIRGLINRVSTEIPVIAYDEITENVKIKNVGMIGALESDFAAAAKSATPGAKPALVGAGALGGLAGAGSNKGAAMTTVKTATADRRTK